MNQLIIPIAAIVALTAFDHMEFNYSDVVQTVQSERLSTSRNQSVSVPQTTPAREITPAPPEVRTIADSNQFSPVAVPVITIEEANKVNEEALRVHLQKETTETKSPDNNVARNNIIESKPAPMAVPVLTPQEAIKVNKEAITFQRYKAIASFFQQKGINRNRIHFILSLLPLLLISDVLFFKRKKNNSKVMRYLSLPRRMRILFSVSLLAFGILVFVPWSVYFGNSQQFSFIFQDFVNWNLSVLTISIVCASIILLLIPPIASDYLIALIAGLGLCVYIQSMFMNQHLGTMTLNGGEPEWSEHYLFGIINIVIWIIIISVPFVLKRIIPSFISRILPLIVGIILLLEIIAVSSLVISATDYVWKRSGHFYVSAENQFHFSKEKNIVVFIFDQLGGDLINPCLEADPQLNETLKDFTWYADARGEYSSTFPGILHEITGAHISPAKDLEDLFRKTWQSSSTKSFYSQMHHMGYDTRLYYNYPTAIGDPENFHEIFSNISEHRIEYIINEKLLHQCLICISGFSALPYLLKKYFFYDENISKDTVEQRIGESKVIQDIPYRNDLYYKKLSSGISVYPGQPVFSIHYTWGAHVPRCVDEECKYHEAGFEDILPQARSCFFILSEFIQQLKDNNIYDNTCIVVFSDHESRWAKYNREFSSISFMIKPFFANNQKIKIDDKKMSSIDILPSLLQIANQNADFSAFDGFPISRIPSDRFRKVYWVSTNPDLPSFNGLDGVPMPNNCFKEFVIIEKDHSFIRYIPWNLNTDLDK